MTDRRSDPGLSFEDALREALGLDAQQGRAPGAQRGPGAGQAHPRAKGRTLRAGQAGGWKGAMRIAIRGHRSLDDVRRQLNEAIDQLQRVGATHTTSTNLYINLCDEAGSRLTVLDTDGDELEILEVPAPKKAKPAKPGSPGANAGSGLGPKAGPNVVPFPRKG